MENCGLSVSRLIGLFRRAKAKGGGAEFAMFRFQGCNRLRAASNWI